MHRYIGLGNPPPPKTQGDVAGLFAQRYGKYVLQDETIGSTTDYTNLLIDVKNGNWTAFGNDAAMAIAQWLGMEVGGPLFAAFLQTIASLEIDFNTPDQYPCTIQGCGGAFGGMTECSVANEFSWDQINVNFEYVPPQGNNPDYQLGPGWGAGAAGMLSWGTDWWRQTSDGTYDWTDPTMKGGPDSFEWALEQAMLAAWQQWSEPPGLCDVIKQVGGDGNINRSYGGGDLANKVWKNLLARLGALIPPMVVAWNATHDPGTITYYVNEGNPSNSTPAPQWYGPSCVANFIEKYPGAGYGLCTITAPQREISYTVSSYTGGYSQVNDPLQMAFDGLALLAGIPTGQEIAVMINSGPLKSTAPPKLSIGGSVHIPVTGNAFNTPSTPSAGVTPAANAATSTASSWLTGLAIAGGAAAIALEIYAYRHRMTLGQATKHLWQETKSKFHRAPRMRMVPSKRFHAHGAASLRGSPVEPRERQGSHEEAAVTTSAAR